MHVPHTIRCCAVGVAILLVAPSAPTQNATQSQQTQQQISAAERGAGVRPLVMPTDGLPPAYAGMLYRTSVMMQGGVAPYSIFVSGELPPGVSYRPGSNVVVFSGVPTSTGTFNSTITVTDAYGASTSHPYSVEVRPISAVTPSPAVITDAETMHINDTTHVFFPAVIKIPEVFHINDGMKDYKAAQFGLPESFHINDKTTVFLAKQYGLPEVFHINDKTTVFLAKQYGLPEIFHINDKTTVKATLGILPATAPAATYNVAYSQTFTAMGNTGTVTMTPTGTLPAGLSYSILSGSVTVSGTPTQLGTFTFTIKAQDSANAATAVTVSYSLVVSGATAQSITIGTLPTPTFGGTPFSVSATSTSGLPVTITYNNGPVTGSGNGPYTPTGSGTVNFTATQPGDTTYSAATPVNFSVNVAAASQTITVGTLPTPTYGGAPFSVSATSNSGLPVTITYQNGPATGSGTGPYTATGGGTVNFIATQDGNNSYAAATPVSFSVTIGAIAQTITVGAIPTPNYSSGTFSVSATSDSGLPVTITYQNGPAAGAGAGPYIITGGGTVNFIASQSGNNSYAPATPVLFSVNITGGPQVITVGTLPTPVYLGPAFSVNASSDSGLPVTIQYVSGPATGSGAGPYTSTGAGTVNFLATQAGNLNYTAAAPVGFSVSVSQASQTISVGAPPIAAYGGPAFNPSTNVTATSGLPVTVTYVSGPATGPAGGPYTATGAGTVNFQATQAGNANYTAAAPVNFSVTVGMQGSITALGVNPSAITPVQTTTLTAAVSAAVIGSPTGTVTFYDNGVQLGLPVPVSGGQAQLTTLLLSGAQVISATYSGDGNFLTSSSTANPTVTVAPLDFTMTPISPISLSVIPGASAVVTFNVTPLYIIYPGPVSFSVSGLPSNASYTVTPTSVAANGGPQTITVTIKTAAATAKNTMPSHGAPIALALFLPLLVLGALRRRRRWLHVLVLLAGVFASSSFVGCGTGTIGNGFFGQTPQTYPVVITATSGTMQHSINVTLQIQ